LSREQSIKRARKIERRHSSALLALLAKHDEAELERQNMGTEGSIQERVRLQQMFDTERANEKQELVTLAAKQELILVNELERLGLSPADLWGN
ncbi:hypothetical protein KIPB_001239, partial [Kipferlia bialata]